MYGSLAIVGSLGGILFYVLFGQAFDEPVPHHWVDCREADLNKV
jgi:hypothetical protein